MLFLVWAVEGKTGLLFAAFIIGFIIGFKTEMMSKQMLFWINLQELKHIVSKSLRLFSVVISLLEQHNTPLLSLHLQVKVTVIGRCVCYLYQ